MVASHAINRELYGHGVRRISGALHGIAVTAKALTAMHRTGVSTEAPTTPIDTKKRQLNAAFLPSRENVKRADRRARNH
ncbi:hypothetical protein FAZ69_22930 [Trinickia terrae]|uniref:Transposase n=1 Tax=Trinickia terrae TaxID=2571161 RepID=A0A4U1HR00_9BURK|nr:hypothetical protein FAZ69_22930 [Trinickia terrae]